MNETEPASSAVAGSTEPGELAPGRLRDAYRWMVLARVVDERSLSLQRQGRIGFYAPLSGQEAAQVGAALALRSEDWVFPAYRELAVALVRGVSLRQIFDQMIGNATDSSRGRQMPNHFAWRDHRYVSASSPIGTQITQAVGAAMAAQRRGDRLVTISFFGDGATSSNDFHAGMNFAGVFRSPTIFLCQNNQWAISLPRERQTRSDTLAEKAAAYGLPGIVVDGNDVRAVHRAVHEARERAVAGGGPTLIEAQVYRFGPHSTSDDPRRYRPEDELAHARSRDPIHRLKALLIQEKLWDDATDAKLWEESRTKIGHAFEESERAPPLERASFFDDVFASPIPRLAEERAEFESLARDRPEGG